ncbi:hypothetical protein C8J56DRAFT_886836 [Mycena floridula]|nr:hypothetical protein C8J56DRAFT_886836 [Mycena floridula]
MSPKEFNKPGPPSDSDHNYGSILKKGPSATVLPEEDSPGRYSNIGIGWPVNRGLRAQLDLPLQPTLAESIALLGNPVSIPEESLADDSFAPDSITPVLLKDRAIQDLYSAINDMLQFNFSEKKLISIEVNGVIQYRLAYGELKLWGYVFLAIHQIIETFSAMYYAGEVAAFRLDP